MDITSLAGDGHEQYNQSYEELSTATIIPYNLILISKQMSVNELWYHGLGSWVSTKAASFARDKGRKHHTSFQKLNNPLLQDRFDSDDL